MEICHGKWIEISANAPFDDDLTVFPIQSDAFDCLHAWITPIQFMIDVINR